MIKDGSANICSLVLQRIHSQCTNAVFVCSGKDAATVMNDLLSAMKKQRLSVSFEVVARCLSHHGQIPQGEYMVVTSVTRLAVDGSVEVRIALNIRQTAICLSMLPPTLCCLSHVGAAVTRASSLLHGSSPSCKRCMALFKPICSGCCGQRTRQHRKRCFAHRLCLDHP